MTLRPWDSAPWTPLAWQGECLPVVLRALTEGRRPIVRACTGAGKTVLTAELAALAASRGRVVVLAVPTEALVEQSWATVSRRWPDCGRWYGRVQERATIQVVCYPSLPSLLDDLAARQAEVGLLIADECHGTEAERRQADIRSAEARWAVGLTATPYRADEREALQLWDEICYEYPLARAMDEGVLVPLVTRETDSAATDGEPVDDMLDRMYRELPTRPDTGRIRPGVVTCRSVVDAEEYAERLRGDGWRVEAVHYQRSPAEVAQAIEGLRVGALDLLTHVSMLSEGVDLPWLWWLALRRQIGSRVMLVQSVGRVLRRDRADGAKVSGYVLDPHGLCVGLGLVHEARLGEPSPMEELEREGSSREAAEPAEIPCTLAGQRVRLRRTEAERIWRTLAVGLEVRGMLPSGVARGRWARRPATRAQRAALERMRWATRHLPDEHRDTWRALADHPELTGGCASDLLSIAATAATAGRDARERRQRWVLDLTPPDESPTP